MLGIREPEIYGKNNYESLCDFIRSSAEKEGAEVMIFQSNHEGEIVTCIQSALGKYDAIVINAAAYTHTSVAILDAMKAVALPAVEVHLSDVNKREEFRKISYVRAACEKTISGLGFESYFEAIKYLCDKYKKEA